MKKAVSHLFPADRTPGESDYRRVADGRPDATAPKSDFWSGFDRNAGNWQREKGNPARGSNKLLNILVPFDFTPPSFNALDCALQLAQNGRARVTFLHAIYLNLSPCGPANPRLIKQDMRRSARARMTWLEVRAKQLNVAADCVIHEGKPSAVIENFIKDNPVDLVILGRHRRKRLGWFMHKNTVDKVVHAAPCPVLVLQTEEMERTLS